MAPGGVRDPAASRSTRPAPPRPSGFGAVWIGERFDTKDLPSLAGAISQVDRTGPDRRRGHRPRRATPDGAGVDGSDPAGADRRALRARPRPIGGVAVAAVRRAGADPGVARATPPTSCAGCGPARPSRTTVPPAKFPELRLAQRPDVQPPPLLLAAVGPKTLALAGRAFDGVILHPFLTPDAVGRSVAIVRDAATAAGRDPAALRCCATVVVAPDRTDGDTALAVGARAAGYFQLRGLGDALASANGWDSDDLARYRALPKLAALGERSADKSLDRDELVELSRAMPADWLPSSSAVGDAATCAARLREYLAAGADELVLHGSTAEHLGGLIDGLRERVDRVTVVDALDDLRAPLADWLGAASRRSTRAGSRRSRAPVAGSRTTRSCSTPSGASAAWPVVTTSSSVASRPSTTSSTLRTSSASSACSRAWRRHGCRSRACAGPKPIRP